MRQNIFTTKINHRKPFIQKITQKRIADLRINFDTFVLTFGVPLIER
jgi:hypothetical protein